MAAAENRPDLSKKSPTAPPESWQTEDQTDSEHKDAGDDASASQERQAHPGTET